MRKIDATQASINKALEPSRKIQQTAEVLRRNLEAIEAPRRVLQQNYAQLDKLLKSYDFLANYRKIAEAGRKFEQVWRQSLPVNWRELDPDPIIEIIRLTREEGIPLVWVPGSELTAAISEKEDREKALAFLVDRSRRVLDDVEAVLDEVTSEELTGWADKARKAIAAYSDGHPETAQAMAAAVVTAGLERGMRFKRLEKVRKTADKVDPDRARLARYRTTLVIHMGSRCVQGRGYEQPGFNRSASLHEVADEQYTSENSLTGIMIAAAILRECQELRDTGILSSENGSNGSDPSS